MPTYNDCCCRCLRRVRQEFKLRSITFQHSRACDFYQSRWPIAPVIYCCIRIALALYLLIWLCVAAFRNAQSGRIPIIAYLTNWAFIALISHLLYAASVTLVCTFITRGQALAASSHSLADCDLDPHGEILTQPGEQAPLAVAEAVLIGHEGIGLAEAPPHYRVEQELEPVHKIRVHIPEKPEAVKVDDEEDVNKGQTLQKPHSATVNITTVQVDPATQSLLAAPLEDPAVRKEASISHASVNRITMDPDDALPWYLKLEWFSFTVAIPGAFIITSVYFGGLYPHIAAAQNLTRPGVVDFHFHGVNSIVAFIEVFMTAMPIRLVHFVYPASMGALYSLFNYLYWLTDRKTIVYPVIMDWGNEPINAIIVIAAMITIVTPLHQLIVFCVCLIRDALSERLATVLQQQQINRDIGDPDCPTLQMTAIHHVKEPIDKTADVS